MAVKEQGNGEELGRIEAIGRRLNDAYCDEVGAARAAIGQAAVTQTPMEFRNDRVTITKEELGAMIRLREYSSDRVPEYGVLEGDR